jgi:hypothetical protein
LVCLGVKTTKNPALNGIDDFINKKNDTVLNNVLNKPHFYVLNGLYGIINKVYDVLDGILL